MNGTAAAPAVAPQPPQPAQAAPPAAVNGSSPAAPVTKAPAEAPLPVSKDSKANVVDKPVDEESKKGRFGWFDIEKVRGRNLSETTNLVGVCSQVEFKSVQHSIHKYFPGVPTLHLQIHHRKVHKRTHGREKTTE